jgi:hypothetical protein
MFSSTEIISAQGGGLKASLDFQEEREEVKNSNNDGYLSRSLR